ncbi:MAG: metallophosphoesterase [Kofleriaceae bacterium]|nr:metallophosphoesterase [Kofleriaceae bacterium]
MTLVAHLSDLHFGAEDPVIAAELLDELRATMPTVIAVSGDLTQRARLEQFAAARAYLARMPAPYLVVPGNHDIPLYRLIARFTHPLRDYERYITTDHTPTFTDNEVCVVGIDTAHGFTFKSGKVRLDQLADACDVFGLNAQRWKLLVAHHPFVLPPGVPANDLVDGAEHALHKLVQARVDLILTGHLHAPYATDAAGFRDRDHNVVAVHAGTCISTRTRGEPNGYNRIVLDGGVVTITHRVWYRDRFVNGASKRYRRGGGADHLVKVGETLGPVVNDASR